MIAYCTEWTVAHPILDPELVAEFRDLTCMPRREMTNEDGSPESVSRLEELQAVMQVRWRLLEVPFGIL